MLFNQTQAAELLGVTPQTIRNYEQQGRLARAATPRPGAWYESADLEKFLGGKFHGVQPSGACSETLASASEVS